MPNVTQYLAGKGLIRPPTWLPCNVHYEVITGSVAYGVSSDTSDNDVYGFCIPPKEVVFPHLAGHIHKFGRRRKEFEQFEAPHIHDAEAGKQYDLTIFNIVKFFSLCMDNNPNMVDCLFVPSDCVLHSTRVGQLVRENRRIFLHKGSWHRFKGYAYQQVHKMKLRSPQAGSKRAAAIEQYGFDVKYAYHVIRLLDEIDQILTLGDLDLRRDRERMKAVRRGEWTIEQVEEFFARREKELEMVYQTSTAIPSKPDEDKIKALLLTCLEEHYGNLGNCVVLPNAAEMCLSEIRAIVDRYGRITQAATDPAYEMSEAIDV